MTNDLGHGLAQTLGLQATQGAYHRRGAQSWIPGAVMDVWSACARGEGATGVPAPHVYFMQTLGDGSAESGSIHCPTCRAELIVGRASGIAAPSVPRVAPPAAPVPQAALPF